MKRERDIWQISRNYENMHETVKRNEKIFHPMELKFTAFTGMKRKRCPNCDKIVLSDSSFCPNCMYPISGAKN